MIKDLHTLPSNETQTTEGKWGIERVVEELKDLKSNNLLPNYINQSFNSSPYFSLLC